MDKIPTLKRYKVDVSIVFSFDDILAINEDEAFGIATARASEEVTKAVMVSDGHGEDVPDFPFNMNNIMELS